MVHYCGRDCQRAHWNKHKHMCGQLGLPEEYPASTLDDLRKAFPQHNIIDGSDVTFASVVGWVATLEADPAKVLVVLRRRSASHVTPTDHLFQMMAPAALVSSMGCSSAILVFHKDDYYHMSKQPFDVLERFLRRRIVGEQPPAGDCPVCFEHMPALHAHRVECTNCGMRVCNVCVAGIIEKSGGERYTCPGCRDQPPIACYMELPTK